MMINRRYLMLCYRKMVVHHKREVEVEMVSIVEVEKTRKTEIEALNY